MALLTGLARKSRWGALTLLLLGLTLTGCVLFDALDPKEKRFTFSHRIHVVDQGLDCADCHRKVETDDDPGMPSAKQCALCHVEQDAEKPPERKVETLYEGNQYKLSRSAALTGEVVFSHKEHAARESDCSACHVGIDQNDDVLEMAAANMDSCMSCHAQRSAPNECATCHTEIREDVRPPSHDHLWMRQHGQVVCERGDRVSDRCTLCHTDSSCLKCHLEVAPTNHTNYWRMRGHGATASLDRQSCAVCHRDDSCASCHAEVKPLNHTGTWGAPVDRHCVSCHFPIQNEGCFVCHQGTPSHALATPKPPDHSAAMNCRMCHGVGQPLPHVDNGDNCNLCHM